MFFALDSNLSQGSLRRLQCTGLLFCLPLLASAWFWIRGCSDVLLSGQHRGHAELFCDELSRSRGLSHGTGECESNLFGDFSRQWTELCDNWRFCLDQRREWISVGCQDIRSEFRV